MCAIFGTIGLKNRNLIDEISKKQIFRGPDEQNIYSSPDGIVNIGNNRLSVIDKQNGQQPMFSEDKRFITVFNGCIYNFNQIKEYLIKEKINFKTKSDTEVVANAFMFFGEKAFNYFDGMWSIAIYDDLEKKLLLSRDYVGQKPLYYSKQNDYFIFSSQIEGIILNKESTFKISKENLKKYFAYSFFPPPYTIFNNVYQVEPGENIIFKLNNSNIERKKYWDIKNGPDYNIFFKPINKKSFKGQFESVIKEHMISDEMPALCLSGGIDSYLIMDQLTKNTNSINTFTLGFENKTYDEAKYVNDIDIPFKKNVFYASSEDIKNTFTKLSGLLTEPIGDSSLIPTYILNKKIRTYSNVAIGGDGGDENFFGYITFDAYYLAKKIKKIFPKSLLKLIGKYIGKVKVSSNYISFATKLKKFFGSLHLDHQFLLPNWMNSLDVNDLAKLFKESTASENIYVDIKNIFSDQKDFMRNAQLYYFKFYLPMVLAKVDQASMLNSVESRSPFLSKKIINFSLNEDIINMYKLFNKKYLIKKIYKKDIPLKILKREKHGFAFPKEIILKDKKLVYDSLDKKFIFNSNFFEEKYKNYLNNSEDCSQYLWNEIILNLSIQNLSKSGNIEI